MENSEWRSKLDGARTRVATTIKEEIVASIETQVLYALYGAENDDVSVCISLLDGLDSAYQQLLTDPQAKPEPDNLIAFGILAASARGEEWEDSGLERVRSKRDAARAHMAGLNLEFLIRAWLEWRLKETKDAQ